MRYKLGKVIRKEMIVTSIIVFVILSFISVGFAAYGSDLTATGTATIVASSGGNGLLDYTSYGTVGGSATGKITNVERSENTEVQFKLNTETTISAGTVNGEFTYEITILNDTSDIYTYDGYNGWPYCANYTAVKPVVIGITKGDYLYPGKSVTIKMTYYIEGEVTSDTSIYAWDSLLFQKGKVAVSNGTVTASLANNKFVVDGSTDIFSTSISVSNNQEVSTKYTLRSSDSRVSIVDANGLSTTGLNYVNSASTDKTDLYLKLDNVDFEESISADLFLDLSDGSSVSIGTVLFTKDASEVVESKKDETTSYETSVSIEKYSSWADHYSLKINITNNADTNLKNFTIFVKLKDDFTLGNSGSWGPNGFTTVFDYDNNLIKIQSDNQWNQNMNMVVAPGATYTTGESTLNITGVPDGYDLNSLVEYVKIYDGFIANS